MSDANDQDLIFFNGIDGDSGEYALPPMTGEELAGFIQGESKPENLNELRFRFQQSKEAHFGVVEGVDPKNLSEAGWGVIFTANADPAIKAALKELIDLRQEQAGDHFRLFDNADGYRPSESKNDFLARHGAGPGPADPEHVPYYLLIVGSPEDIPYQFQTQVDVQYAVGRIHFDKLEDYASYARSVVDAEKGNVKLARQAAFFGVSNPGDKATQLSTESLIQPLLSKLQTSEKDWQLNGFLRDQATKSQLSTLLGGNQTPALLFTGSHGMSFPLGSPRQEPYQGALLCQDFPGPAAWRGKGAIPPDFFFAGEDVASDANVLGLIAFFFACYGGGTPLNDEFSKQAFKQRTAIASRPFLANLPKKLLGHPRGGALAVIGHIERAWGYSFFWPQAGEQTAVFESTLQRLMSGYPVGSAVEFFNERYAELSTVLNDEIEDIEFGKKADPFQLAGMWTANNDARGYAVIGDPAVRLPLTQDKGQPSERPQIASVTLVSTSPSASPGPVKSGSGSSAPAIPMNAGQDFGLIDTLSNTRERLTASLSQFTDRLSQALERALDDAVSLEVTTYVMEDISVPKSGEFPAGAKLRAYTRIQVDGDTQVIVPEKAGEIHKELWAIHLDMVQQAQANRAEMIKATAAAAGGLLQALKIV